MELRYRAALRIVADYSRMDFTIYSPIAHYHNVAANYDLPTSFDFWQQRNFDVLRKCDEVWILPLKGWEASVGLTGERREAKRRYKKITYLWEDAKRLGV